MGGGQLGATGVGLDRDGEVDQGATHRLPRLLARGAPAAYPGHLEHRTRAAHVAHVAGGQLGDVDPAVGRPRGHALVDQRRQRLADGGAGDPHRVGQRHLAQRGARLDVAVEQRAAQLVGDPVHGRGVLEAEPCERAGPPRLGCHACASLTVSPAPARRGPVDAAAPFPDIVRQEVANAHPCPHNGGVTSDCPTIRHSVICRSGERVKGGEHGPDAAVG